MAGLLGVAVVGCGSDLVELPEDAATSSATEGDGAAEGEASGDGTSGDGDGDGTSGDGDGSSGDGDGTSGDGDGSSGDGDGTSGDGDGTSGDGDGTSGDGDGTSGDGDGTSGDGDGTSIYGATVGAPCDPLGAEACDEGSPLDALVCEPGPGGSVWTLATTCATGSCRDVCGETFCGDTWAGPGCYERCIRAEPGASCVVSLPVPLLPPGLGMTSVILGMDTVPAQWGSASCGTLTDGWVALDDFTIELCGDDCALYLTGIAAEFLMSCGE